MDFFLLLNIMIPVMIIVSIIISIFTRKSKLTQSSIGNVVSSNSGKLTFIQKIFLGKIIEEYSENDVIIDFNEIGPIWQPVTINTTQINKNLIKIGNIYETIKRKKEKINSINKIFISIIILGIILGIAIIPFVSIQFGAVIVILSTFPYLSTKGFLKSLSKDLIKVQITEENNWLYDPYPDYDSWNNLKIKYHEIFKKGDEEQNIEDQIWGKVQKDSKDYYFYSGLFNYNTVHYDSKGRRNSSPHLEHFIGVRLNKKISSRFYLYPENVFSKIGNFFTNKEINTESIEFNKNFAFSYNGKKSEKGMDIIQTLSPAVKQKLIKLKKENKTVRILFSEDSVFFIFIGAIMENVKTNILKDESVNKEDKDLFQNKLNTLIDISSDISKYLD